MKKIVFFSLSLLSVSAMALSIWLVQQDMEKQLSAPLNIHKAELLELHSGESLKSLGNRLVENNWIAHPHYLIWEGKRLSVARKLKIGEYTIKPGTSPRQLLDLLVSGKVRQYSITIPEGWSFVEIMKLIVESSELEKTLSSTLPKAVMAELGYSGFFPEGRIFPDTYLFPAGTSDKEFLIRAIKTGEDVLTEEWSNRQQGLPYSSAYEALVMASIIEKETGVAHERSEIAGVFVRRLGLNMKLQTDPTVIYAMAETFDGNIRRKDLSIDSPYNTYRYRGLPPTPIASPGRAAIHAALHPAEGKSLYFVAKGDGSHYFSENLKQHNNAVRKYQLKKK